MPVPPSPSAAVAAAAAARVLGPSRRDVLNLYRSLLRIHAAVLPAPQRALGDRVRLACAAVQEPLAAGSYNPLTRAPA